MPIFKRQTGSELDAWKLVAGYRAKGHWTSEPCRVLSCNQKTWVYEFAVSVDKQREGL